VFKTTVRPTNLANKLLVATIAIWLSTALQVETEDNQQMCMCWDRSYIGNLYQLMWPSNPHVAIAQSEGTASVTYPGGRGQEQGSS
jgi:hypothetical protein